MTNILAKRIRKIRFDAEMTQEVFAQRCLTNSAMVSRWESGRSEPRPRHLKAIAQVAGITVDELLADPEEPRNVA